MSVNPEGAGSVALNGDTSSSQFSSTVTQTFLLDSPIQLEAKPAEGYRFTGWGGDLSGVENPTSVQFSDCVTVTASFASAPVVTVLVSGNGTTFPEVGRHTYEEGGVVSLTATADKGWKFDGWTGGVSDPASATTTVAADADKNVTARFSQIMHTLTVNSNHGGRSLSTVGTYQYPEGTTVDVATTIEKGWRFNGWSGDVLDIKSETTSVMMDSDKTVTADFVRTRPDGGQIGVIAGAVASGLVALYIAKRKPKPGGSNDGDSLSDTAE